VAGALLVPSDSLLSSQTVKAHGSDPEWTDDELRELARRYWVSWEVALRRLLVHGKTTAEFYRDWRNSRRDKYPEVGPSGEVKLPMAVRVVRRHGRLFPRLVLSALSEQQISSHAAASYLGAGPQYLPKIQSEVFESRYLP
jgi:Zn-dependent peptidase ImmA (M78 family)